MDHSDAQLKLLHDLRSPLTAILGFTELLEDCVAGPLNERQLRYVQQVLSAGQTMLLHLDESAHQLAVQHAKSDAEQSLIFPEQKAPMAID